MRFLYIIFAITLLLSCKNDSQHKLDSTVQTDTAFNSKEVAKQDTLQHPTLNNTPHFTGIIQTTGLLKADAKAIGLETGRFQLIGKDQNYFLEGIQTIEKNLGKCVNIWGEINRKKGADPNVFDYDRSTIKVVDIILAPEKMCSCEITTSKEQILKNAQEIYGPEKNPETIIGKIKRNKRPAPDVAYDYVMNLDLSFIDNQDPSGKPRKVENIVILPTDYKMLRSFEINFLTQSTVSLHGYKLGGFAESTVFHVLDMN